LVGPVLLIYVGTFDGSILAAKVFGEEGAHGQQALGKQVDNDTLQFTLYVYVNGKW
jgi:hypothetical protein